MAKKPHVRKILQIMPADGWVAVFHEADGREERNDVIAFALMEGDEYGDRHVTPIAVGDGMPFFPDEVGTFAGIERGAPVGERIARPTTADGIYLADLPKAH